MSGGQGIPEASRTHLPGRRSMGGRGAKRWTQRGTWLAAGWEQNSPGGKVSLWPVRWISQMGRWCFWKSTICSNTAVDGFRVSRQAWTCVAKGRLQLDLGCLKADRCAHGRSIVAIARSTNFSEGWHFKSGRRTSGWQWLDETVGKIGFR